MEEITSEEINKDNIISQQSYKNNTEENAYNKYISIMNEKETSSWLKKLNLDEEILKGLEEIIKNGKDLIAIYNNKTILDKLSINLHSTNIINDAIEEGLEEQLKININLEKGKNIILNIENEPKYRLKEILAYLEKLLKCQVYLSPVSSPNEILTPNTLIVKKILLNPNKYCNLQLFDEKSVRNNNRNEIDLRPPIIQKSEKKNKNEIALLNNTNKNINNLNIDNNKDITNLNKDSNINFNKNLINVDNYTNNTKTTNLTKGYVSLFQNKKNNLPDFTTDYQMPSQNKTNGNNFIKLENKNISKPIEDFKYHNILSMKDKEEKEDKKNIMKDIRLTNDNINNINNNNEPKNIGFKNISNYKNINMSENDNNNINKNYFTQRNFNTKNNPNDNNMMFQQMLTKKRSEKNISDIMAKNNMDILGEVNENISMLERNKRELEKERDININFINKENNNNDIKKQNNKTENRYEFSRLQDLDKDYFSNKIFNLPKAKTIQENNNDLNNLIINQKDELKNSKEKYGANNLKEDSENDILKVLREKYSLENNDIKDSDSNRINVDFKKEYKPKTPINEGRRIINNDNVRFTNLTDDNSNNPLENKFLMQQKDNFMKSNNNNLLNKNNQMIFNMNKEEEDDNNIMTKYKIDNMNLDNNNKLGKNRMNRPSPGLDFNNFQYKATGYKSSFPQETSLNQYNPNNE